MNLRIARVCKERTLLISLPSRAHVTALSIGGKVEDVAVATRCKADCVSFIAFKSTGNEVTHHDTASLTVNDDEVLHIATREQLHRALSDLAHHRLVSAEEELLTGLATCVERTGNLSTTEGTISKKSTVVAAERNALSHALVNNQIRVFSETMHVRFTSAEVTALHGIVEETINGVTVVRIVLSSVDTALCSNGVCTTRRILIAECKNVVTKFTQGSSGTCTGKTRTHDDDLELTLVGRVHKLEFELVTRPFFRDRTTRNMGIQNHISKLLPYS